MAKRKSVTHLPAPAPPPSAPRLAVQLLVALGEIVVVAACVLGFVTAAGWMIAGADMRTIRATRQPPLQQATLVCWIDRRYGEMCMPADRPPPARRHFAGDYRF